MCAAGRRRQLHGAPELCARISAAQDYNSGSVLRRTGRALELCRSGAGAREPQQFALATAVALHPSPQLAGSAPGFSYTCRFQQSSDDRSSRAAASSERQPRHRGRTRTRSMCALLLLQAPTRGILMLYIPIRRSHKKVKGTRRNQQATLWLPCGSLVLWKDTSVVCSHAASAPRRAGTFPEAACRRRGAVAESQRLQHTVQTSPGKRLA